MKRCTWSKPDGSWGIEGVDLADLPPQLYRAVTMLERLEKQVEQINVPDIQDWQREDLVQELNDMLGLKLPGIGVNLCSTQIITKSEVLQKAIRTYGIDLQLDMAIEEMSELIKEICKYNRGKENQAEITEELADVKIMLEQMKIIFDISDNDVDKITEIKLERLARQLKIVTVDETN